MEDTKKTIDESLNEAGEQTKNADTGGTTTDDTKKTLDESTKEGGEHIIEADTKKALNESLLDDSEIIKGTMKGSMQELRNNVQIMESAIVEAVVETANQIKAVFRPAAIKTEGHPQESDSDFDDIKKLLCKRIKVAAKNGMIDKPMVEQIAAEGMNISLAFIGKYTIVDIGFGGCTYQGLASKHPDDEINIKEGIGRALSRAFDKMCVRNRFKNQKDLQIITGEDLSESITWKELEALIETD